MFSGGWTQLQQQSLYDMNKLIQGFGSASEFHKGLAKALSSGTSIDSTLTSATSIVALRLEDLNNVLTTLTYSQKQLVLWPWIKKGSAFNVLYQYNTKDTVGLRRASPFYIEGGRPLEQDEEFTRHTRQIKYLGVEKQITLPAQIQRLGGGVNNINTEAVENGTTLLLRQLEDMLWFSREALDDTNLSFDGIEQQLLDNSPSTNIIDLEGAYITTQNIDDGMSLLNKYYSNLNPNDLGLFMSTDAIKNFAKAYRTTTPSNSIERLVLDNKDRSVVVSGGRFRGFDSQFGYVPFYPSVILNENREDEKISNFTSATSTPGGTAPNVPAGTISVTPVTDTTTKMSAGTYFYSLVTKSREGTSVPLHTATGTACLATQRLDVTWNAPSSGSVNGYYLFRHTADPSVAANQDDVKLVRLVDPTPRSYSDANQWRPGTGVVFLLDGEWANMGCVQLAPFMRYDLARLSTADRFLLLLFVDVVVKNANRQVMFKNVGSTAP